MSEQVTPAAAPASAPAPQVNTAEMYARANKLNARLANSTDASLIREGKELASAMLAHVKSKTDNYDDFVHRVQVSEQYSLTESRQMAKTEKELKSFYLRAATLLEAAQEAEARAAKKRA